MNQALQILQKNIRATQLALDELIQNEAAVSAFQKACDLVVATYRRGGRLFLAGNGGSAADAQHLAAEFVCKLARERAPLPAEALTVDSSVLTSIGNDFGFDQVFARQLRAKASPTDAFLGITTSGQSKNILRALEVCRDRQIPSIVFTGGDGGNAAELGDVTIIVGRTKTSTIQETHILLGHTLCEMVESTIFFGAESP